MQVYIDGEFVDREAAKVSVFDHGFLYGDGVFEGIRVYNRRIFRLQAHLDRLYASARAIALTVPLTPEAMRDTLREAVRRNGRDDAYIRLVITRGVGALGIDPASCPRASVVIIVDDVHLYAPALYARGIAVITSATRQISHESVDPRIKSLNYLKNILAKIDARQTGADEAIMLNAQGFIAECTADNIFVVRSGGVLTPATEDGALGGITRGVIFELAEAAGIRCGEARLTRYDVHTADEVFVTGTGAEIMPVTTADGRAIGEGRPGPVTAQLTDAFHASVRAEGEPLW